MTIPSTLARMPAIAGDGSTTVHSYTFKILDEDDLKIVLVDASGDATTLIKTTHYSVTGVGTNGGGTVVMVTPHILTEDLHILLDTEFTQLVPFQAKEYESAFDRLTLMIKSMGRLVGNALRVKETSGLPASSLIVAPIPNTFIGFDETGAAASMTLADIGEVKILTYPLVLTGDTLSLDAIIPKNKTDASAPPTVNNDATQNYTVLSRWSGTALGDVYVCLDPAEGAAVWDKINGDLAALDAIPADHIATVMLSDGVVTTDKIFNGSVTKEKLSSSNLYENPVLIVQDHKAATVAGGSLIADTRMTRDLNTIIKNEISAVVASNQITLLAGTYRVRLSAPAFYCYQHRVFLHNITDAVDALLGTSEYAAKGTAYGHTRSFIDSEITIATTKIFEVQHQSPYTQASTGLGEPSLTGADEVYTIAIFERVA